MVICSEADLCHHKRRGIVERGHILVQGAAVELQTGVKARAQEAEVGVLIEAEVAAQITMNTLGNQMGLGLLVSKLMGRDNCNVTCVPDHVLCIDAGDLGFVVCCY